MNKEYKVINIEKCVKVADKKKYPNIEKEYYDINKVISEYLINKKLSFLNIIVGSILFLFAILSKKSLKYIYAILSSVNIYGGIYYFSIMKELKEEEMNKIVEFIKKYEELLLENSDDKIK